MVLGGISGVDACHTGVESTTEDSSQAGFLKTFAVGPLPAVFKVSLVAWLVVSGIEVVYSTFEASIHNGEVLIGKSHVDDNVGTMTLEKFNELRHTVGINLAGCMLASVIPPAS